MRKPLLFCALLMMLAHASSSASARCAGIELEADNVEGREVTVCASSHIAVPEGKGTVYNVGPEHPLKALGDVPWFRLEAGDTVYIHYRSEPYREKILVSGIGRPDQWIRILGVPGPNGELPVISGDKAVTSKNARFRWQKPDLIEWLGVVHIAVGPDQPDNPHPQPPAYIEIANLQVQDGFKDYSFQAGDGTWLHYEGFAACIYARSVKNLVVRNTVLTNCGQGFYNWTGDGSSPSWWTALQANTILSGNHFYNNGNPDSYLEHQVYTESDGVTIEYNRFGPQRTGSMGSQIKDRSAGTVIRYNTIEQSPSGWNLDLVEPEESRASLGQKPQFKQTFVYGNSIVSHNVKYPNMVHWNEDHYGGYGRATRADGRLFFYHNTVVIYSARDGVEPYSIFNATWGGYDCPETPPQGVIDVRNNIIAVIPATPGRKAPPIRLGYCKNEKIVLGANWISPGYLRDGNIEQVPNTFSAASSDPGFISADNLRLREGASAAAVGGALASEATQNHLGANLAPEYRFVDRFRLGPRTKVGLGSDLGAY